MIVDSDKPTPDQGGSPAAIEPGTTAAPGVKKSPWLLALSSFLLAGWLIWLISLAIRVGQ